MIFYVKISRLFHQAKNVMKTAALIPLLSIFIYSGTALAETLCQSNEKDIFRCDINGKQLSICHIDNSIYSFRYGQPDAVELRIDSPLYFSTTPYLGGGEGRYRFSHAGEDYFVYDYIADGGWLDKESGIKAKKERQGVYVAKNGVLLKNHKCTNFRGDYIYADYTHPSIEEPFEVLTVRKQQ